MFTALTIYVCLLLVTPKWNIGYPNWICFYFTEYYDTLQPRFIYLPFFGFTRFSQLKSLFGNVYSKRFPTRSLSRIFPMFYSVVNVLELQFFGSVYSQEHLVVAISSKNICNKQLNLLVFPGSLLMFGFNIVFFFCFFCFLIFENHQSKRWRARFNVFRDSQWRYKNYITDIILIYISLTVDMFFSHLPSQSYICFLNTVSALSLSDVSIIESLSLTLSGWQSFPGRLEHFLIQNTFRQPHLL